MHQIAVRQGPSQAVAAGKLNYRGLIRFDRLNRGGPIRGCLSLDKVRQADAAGIDEIAQSLHVEHDDPRQRRTAIADRQDFVELLFILHESQPGSAGRQQMANAIRLLVRVDGNTGRAATQDRQVGVNRLRPRFRQDRHHVATREIRQQQCQPDLADLGVKLSPGNGPPDAAVLDPQDRLPRHRTLRVATKAPGMEVVDWLIVSSKPVSSSSAAFRVHRFLSGPDRTP